MDLRARYPDIVLFYQLVLYSEREGNARVRQAIAESESEGISVRHGEVPHSEDKSASTRYSNSDGGASDDSERDNHKPRQANREMRIRISMSSMPELNFYSCLVPHRCTPGGARLAYDP